MSPFRPLSTPLRPTIWGTSPRQSVQPVLENLYGQPWKNNVTFSKHLMGITVCSFITPVWYYRVHLKVLFVFANELNRIKAALKNVWIILFVATHVCFNQFNKGHKSKMINSILKWQFSLYLPKFISVHYILPDKIHLTTTVCLI